MDGVWQSKKLQEVFFLEEHRIASFQRWPFDDNSACNIAKLAEAGFYWSGNKRDIDTVTCFVCGKVLDGWEPTDDPWKEHLKHAPQCEFVKFGRKQNDLLVEEFLQIFSALIKNKLQAIITKNQQDLRSLATTAHNEFTESQWPGKP